ncbi:MAG: hypothetical protein HQK77_02140 [Desulfobacterales bacterium]|nr:hypothetical protein [Desulfobacterales bacterium]
MKVSENQHRREYVKPFALSYITPLWKGNLIIFGLLILIVLLYFLWQIHQATRIFYQYVEENTSLISRIIQVNAKNTVLSKQIVEALIESFLGNMSRFIDYLDTVEPFTAEELTAFAMESGLSGIMLINESGKKIQGPDHYFDFLKKDCRTANHSLNNDSLRRIYFLILPRPNSGCIIVAMTTAMIDALKDNISLPRLLNILSSLKGILYVTIRSKNNNEEIATDHENSPVRVFKVNGLNVAEAKMTLGRDILLVGLDAKRYYTRVQYLWIEFIIFSVLLTLIGAFFSWILYHYQNAYLEEVRNFERRLAQEKEDATIGRATATITHEIRNPLNAISMGLQRLQLEATDLNQEHLELIESMQISVQRTNRIMKNLQRYSKPLVPKKDHVHIDVLIQRMLVLYKTQFSQHQLDVHYNPVPIQPIRGDQDLIQELIENLLKNAIEAQPAGGIIDIELYQINSELLMTFRNRGLTIDPLDIQILLEPYFTTKTTGSGLGLPICQKIVYAHDGRMTLSSPSHSVLEIQIILPSLMKQ